MAMAGKITIAEVEELVPAGESGSESDTYTGIYVHRIFQERITKSASSNARCGKLKQTIMLDKFGIAKRIAKELKTDITSTSALAYPPRSQLYSRRHERYSPE